MKIAVEGCLHGELDAVYNVLLQRQRREGIKIDLLICCGDFQAIRNKEDMRWMKVPNKYKTMGTFYKYYSGELRAPMLTVFVGGNHEASNHLTELAYGGWVAPNIYYLGYSGVVQFGGLRIAGVSGIYNHHHYHLGHFERPPFDNSMLTSAYHVRSFEVFKLKQLSGKIDIFVSHDWPVEIYHHGNTENLLKWKSFFRKEVETNTLGSPAGKELLDHLKPLRWWAGHLHCRFEAKYVHKITEQPSRPTASEDMPTALTVPTPTPVAEVTEFLALDKCLPKRQFLEVFEFPEPPYPKVLCYDHQWLAITKAVNQLMPLDRLPWQPPSQAGSDRTSFVPAEDYMKEIHEIFKGDFTIPQNFQMSVQPFNPMSPWQQGDGVVDDNPQTVEFCSKLKIRNNFSCKLTDCDYQTPKESSSVKQVNPDEIVIDDDDEDNDEEYITGTSKQTSLPQTTPSSDPLDDKNRKEIEPEQKRKKEM